MVSSRPAPDRIPDRGSISSESPHGLNDPAKPLVTRGRLSRRCNSGSFHALRCLSSPSENPNSRGTGSSFGAICRSLYSIGSPSNALSSKKLRAQTLCVKFITSPGAERRAMVKRYQLRIAVAIFRRRFPSLSPPVVPRPGFGVRFLLTPGLPVDQVCPESKCRKDSAKPEKGGSAEAGCPLGSNDPRSEHQRETSC